jgi:hypothetical protein
MKRTAVSVIVTLVLLGVFTFFAVKAAPALSPARLAEFARRLGSSVDPHTPRSAETPTPTMYLRLRQLD